MNILGIETSCDETAASIVADGHRILSHIVISSLKEHRNFGGIIPELASRRQLEYINPIVQQSLDKAKLKLNHIDAVAVTVGPGLIGSLLVGISFARALSFALRKPLAEVDHIQAHLYANFLTPRERAKDVTADSPPTLPAVGLVVSGGHTSLFYLKDFKDFKLLGQTLDDAAGETFDKVARILGLDYPGGPAIDRLASTVQETTIRFTCALLPDTLNFSFSGIKTAVLYFKRDYKDQSIFPRAEAAYAFQHSVVEVLVKKCLLACKRLKTNTLLVGGGVAANSRLRQRLTLEVEKQGIKVYFPPLALCMDNAAMIAGLGFHFLKKKNKGARL